MTSAPDVWRLCHVMGTFVTDLQKCSYLQLFDFSVILACVLLHVSRIVIRANSGVV
jgi:hypothetical protein